MNETHKKLILTPAAQRLPAIAYKITMDFHHIRCA
jgi:hypothetical protein